MTNIHTLVEQGIWAIPSTSRAYSPIINKSEPGDAVIFTHRGEPVATGVLNSVPKQGIMGVWPDQNQYRNTFSVKVNRSGRISRERRDDLDIDLRRGVVNYSDINTYYKCRSELQPVNLSNLAEAGVE